MDVQDVEFWDIQTTGQFISNTFSDEVARNFKDQDIDGRGLLELINQPFEAAIFRILQLTFGKVVKLKSELKRLLPGYEDNNSTLSSIAGTPSPVGSIRGILKPNMSDLSEQQRLLYKMKRNKINKACVKKWPGNNFPNFRLPEDKEELDDLAASLCQECSMPEINFGLDGIKEHIKAVFYERRRSRKRLGTDYDKPDKRRREDNSTHDYLATGCETPDPRGGLAKSSTTKADRKLKPVVVYDPPGESDPEDNVGDSDICSDKLDNENVFNFDTDDDDDDCDDSIVQSSQPSQKYPSSLMKKVSMSAKQAPKKKATPLKDDSTFEFEELVSTNMLSDKSAEVVILVYTKHSNMDSVSREELVKIFKTLGGQASLLKSLDKKQLTKVVSVKLINKKFVKIVCDAKDTIKFNNLKRANVKVA